MDYWVVAVGRALAHILPSFGYGLRVHVVAPVEERVKQIAGDVKLDIASAKQRTLHYDRECEHVFRVWPRSR